MMVLEVSRRNSSSSGRAPTSAGRRAVLGTPVSKAQVCQRSESTKFAFTQEVHGHHKSADRLLRIPAGNTVPKWNEPIFPPPATGPPAECGAHKCEKQNKANPRYALERKSIRWMHTRYGPSASSTPSILSRGAHQNETNPFSKANHQPPATPPRTYRIQTKANSASTITIHARNILRPSWLDTPEEIQS